MVAIGSGVELSVVFFNHKVDLITFFPMGSHHYHPRVWAEEQWLALMRSAHERLENAMMMQSVGVRALLLSTGTGIGLIPCWE